ncbi:DUF6710 family protein [Massilia sp. PAMC28688]|uniref:DUF6710 family protein n=1 Tax=Massilia sp. PAMC28688 TaxID=2861283 RepID=UPI0035A64B4D
MFTRLMEIANGIHRQNATGLARLVSAILGPLQSDHLLSVAERVQHAAVGAASLERLFSPDYFFSLFDPSDCVQLRPEDYSVDLARDIVLSTPWNRNCFVNALANIGSGRSCGTWRQDPNHAVSLVLPWRFGIVINGNHSIAAGILGREGVLTPSEVLDLTPLLNRVRCDGNHFVRRDSGENIARIQNGRTAALFEIGRLMATAQPSRGS